MAPANSSSESRHCPLTAIASCGNVSSSFLHCRLGRSPSMRLASVTATPHPFALLTAAKPPRHQQQLQPKPVCGQAHAGCHQCMSSGSARMTTDHHALAQSKNQTEQHTVPALAVGVMAGSAAAGAQAETERTGDPPRLSTGAMQHSAAVPGVSAVAVDAGLDAVFVASPEQSNSAPQVPGTMATLVPLQAPAPHVSPAVVASPSSQAPAQELSAHVAPALAWHAAHGIPHAQTYSK